MINCFEFCFNFSFEFNLCRCMKEPILCAPNDPDDARTLSDVTGDKIDEVFIGSCMTNIGQGLTHVHVSSQPEPFLTQDTP